MGQESEDPGLTVCGASAVRKPFVVGIVVVLEVVVALVIGGGGGVGV